MREIRKSGSEGGARQINVSFLPLSAEETVFFTGNLEGEDLTSAVRRRFGLSDREALIHLARARE